MARMCRTLGMNVAYHNRRRLSDSDAHGAEYMELDELFKRCDVISIHCPLTDSTRGLVSAERIALMKSDALIINTSRGGVIDTDALINALKAHRIGGAALDVFDIEPLPTDSPFYALDNVLLTPHLAGSTCDTRLARLKCFLPDLEGYFRTGRIQAKVNFR